MMPQGKEEKQAERKPAWLPGFLAKGRNKKATKPLRLNPKTPGAHREDMSQDDVLRLHEAAREYPTSNCHATVGKLSKLNLDWLMRQTRNENSWMARYM
ncbi:hypothetical protein H106_00036 [Trichophyton rubrum CBS 735.88]|nr:hypothetical protein H102_00143 [Trichophyton rubrum CBS 100081]EZF89555.1 hypothetical protein H110_00145 [Trichophyton rubrum MR1448]EZG11269.1 hypothetical protein H106_00036 [Trichophyton rubrum CBS 735.88]